MEPDWEGLNLVFSSLALVLTLGSEGRVCWLPLDGCVNKGTSDTSSPG